MERRPTALHRIEYLLTRAVTAVLRLLPERFGLGLCGGIGWLAGAVLRVRRSVVDDNLAIAFPERTRAWRARVARASYAHLGREFGVLLRTSLVDPERVRAGIEQRTWFADEASEGAFTWICERSQRGEGTIIVTGHLGNWEVGGSALAIRGLPLCAVAVGQANPLFDARLRETRARLGIELLGKSEAATRVTGALTSGKAVGLVADQNAREAGVSVQFFGRAASTARGAALFALRSGSPLVLTMALREPGWPQRYRIHLEPLEWEASGDLEADLLTLTQAHTSVLERYVRSAPEQYLWQHKRWRGSTAPRPGVEEPVQKAPVLPG